MIVLYVLVSIIALVVILLHFSVRAEFSAENKNVLVVIKYFWFKIFEFKIPEDDINSKAKTESYEPAENNSDVSLSQEGIEKFNGKTTKMEKQNETENDSEAIHEPLKRSFEKKQTEENKKPIKKSKKKRDKTKPESKGKFKHLKAKWNKIKPFIPTAWKGVKKLLKTIRISKLEIDIEAGKDDAYESALNYGKTNAAVYNGIAALSLIFTVRIKSCNIKCLFNENTFNYKANATVYIRPSAVIAIAVCTLVNFLIIYFKEKSKAKKALKKARKINSETTKKEMLVNE